MAAGQFLHHVCGPVPGRDLFCVSNHGGTLLLDDPTGFGRVGAVGVLDRGVHQLAWSGKMKLIMVFSLALAMDSGEEEKRGRQRTQETKRRQLTMVWLDFSPASMYLAPDFIAFCQHQCGKQSQQTTCVLPHISRCKSRKCLD